MGDAPAAGDYLAVGLLVSSSLCVLTPAFDVPDESNHARREVQIAHGQVIAEKTADGVGGTTDAGFETAAKAMDGIHGRFHARDAGQFRDGRVTAAELTPLKGIRWAGQMMFEGFPNTAVYPPGLYLPQALGWRIGEARDWTIFHSLLLARVFAAICALAIGWLTLRLCGQQRWAMFAYLLLPTVLNLGASCLQDALLLPMAGLAMVVLGRATAAQRVPGWRETLLLALMLTLCAGARVPYLPLALVLLLPAMENSEKGWRKWVRPVTGILLVTAVVGAWQIAVHPLGVVSDVAADPARQTSFLKANPLRGLASLLDAMVVVIPGKMVKGLYMLGSNDVGPSHALYAVTALGAVGVGLLNPLAGLKSRTAKATLLLALFGAVAGVWLAEYIFWTIPETLRVLDHQPRYFLPLLPFAMLLGWRWVPGLLRETTRVRLLSVAATMFLAGVLAVPFVAAQVFYAMGIWPAVRLVLN